MSPQASKAKSSEETITESENTVHPLCAFLMKSGLAVDTFPVIRFTIESPCLALEMKPRRIILRVPDFEFGFYESILRVVRVVEISPRAKSKAKQLITFEWTFSIDHQPAEVFHPLFGLLAAEMVCASCRELFTPKPVIRSESSIELSCPHCRGSWNLDLGNSQSKNYKPNILEEYRSNPKQILQTLESWPSRPSSLMPVMEESSHQSYFPVALEEHDHTDILCKVNPKSLSFEFDDFVCSITNLIAFRSLAHQKLLDSQNEQSRLSNVAFDITRSKSTAKGREAGELTKTKRTKKRSATSWLSLLSIPVLVLLTVGPSFFSRPSILAPTSSAAKESELVRPNNEEIQNAMHVFLEKHRSFKANQNLINSLADSSNHGSTTPTTETAKPRISVTAKPAVKVKRLKEEDPDFRQGRIHFKVQQYPEAIQSFKRALEKDAKNLDIYPSLILSLFETQNYHESATILETYLTMPLDPELRPALESLHAKLKSFLGDRRQPPSSPHSFK